MSDELKNILASIFRMGKGSSLSRVEMRNLLVYNLRWFSPEKADRVVESAISSGLVRTEKDGMIVPAFDISSVKLDIDYTPPRDLDLEKMVRPLFERLIDTIMTTGLDRKETVRSINKKVTELNMIFPCAAVFVGIERGADMSAFYPEIENSILFQEGSRVT